MAVQAVMESTPPWGVMTITSVSTIWRPGEMKGAAQAPGKMTFGIAFSADNRQVIGVGNSATGNRVEIWSWQEKAEPKLLKWLVVSRQWYVPGSWRSRRSLRHRGRHAQNIA